MTAAPLVTLAMPVFNGERYLEETLASLLGQELTDFELVISDNGSTDTTEAICRTAAATDPRVIYHRHERNQGAAWNYNHLVGLARGRYIKWCGHDDICEPTHLVRCVDALEAAGPAAVLAYPRTVLINADGGRRRSYDDGLDLRDTAPHDRFAGLLRNLGLANAVFGLIRTDVLASTQLIGAYNLSDLVLLCELALRGQLLEVPEELFRRRMHAGSSHEANPTLSSVREWFSGREAKGPVFERTRLITEIVRAILRAPLTRAEQAACLAVLVRTWGPRYSKLIAVELVRAVPEGLRAAIPRRTTARAT
jgi:glycosyltransferase involved in cell wall biosynthesis